jgi:DNA-binding NtrC family response regulator
MPPKILVADDDPALLEMMRLSLSKEGFVVDTATTGSEAQEKLSSNTYDLVVSDIYLGDLSAIDILDHVRTTNPGASIILVTAQGTVETAAAATAAGVFDYLPKPFELDTLIDRVRASLRSSSHGRAPVESGPESMIVGNHPKIVEVYKAVARVARLPIPVVVTGETGTGKELVARSLHRFGAHSEGPFVAINCGAIPDSLLESELFGHRRGAFTGADHDHRGAIQSARDGTVFLDEIGELPTLLQVKLLRFLQDGGIRPLGSEAELRVPARVVAATNRDLRAEVAAGRFREDFYFRLAGYEVHLPPLRDRRSDIPLLVEHFRVRIEQQLGIDDFAGPGDRALAILTEHRWPGNVRELESVVRRAAIDLGSLTDADAVANLLTTPPNDELPARATIGDDLTLEELERLHIKAVLARCGGNRTRAASVLGIERKSLYRKAQRLGIELD